MTISPQWVKPSLGLHSLYVQAGQLAQVCTGDGGYSSSRC